MSSYRLRQPAALHPTNFARRLRSLSTVDVVVIVLVLVAFLVVCVFFRRPRRRQRLRLRRRSSVRTLSCSRNPKLG